jgi:FdhD protein
MRWASACPNSSLPPDEFESADAHAIDGGGWMLRVQIAPSRAAPLLDRARLRLAEGSCGLCGIESLEQVLRPLPQVTARLDVADTALFAALAALPTISRWARRRAPPTPPRSARPMARSWPRARTSAATTPSTSWSARWRARAIARQGFVVLTARCSYELVQKAVIAGFPLLVTVSAASTMAAERAAAHGLRLYSLARGDSLLES